MGTAPTADDVNTMVRDGFPGSSNECVELGPGWALARRLPSDADIRPGGFISGPTQFGLADGALWYAVFTAIGRIEPMALTSELSIRYLRPCIGTTLWAKGTIDSAGRRNVVGTVKIWTDGNDARPCAVAQGTYVLPASSPSPRSGTDPLRP